MSIEINQDEKCAMTQQDTPVRNTKSRNWCFTWNNYTEDDVNYIKKMLVRDKYLFGKEIGTNNTPHLQGVVKFTNARCFASIKKLFKNNHVEMCKNWAASITYCKKDKDIVSNFLETAPININEELLKIRYKNVAWKPWQQKIIDEINDEINVRKITWIFDKIGNQGKTYLCKYIVLKYNAIICSGKTNDIFNQVKTWRDQNPNDLQIPIVLIDVPRSDYNHINYSAIEQLKNGMLYSGKYEGGLIVGLEPHVIVFANKEPDDTQLSLDRLSTLEIKNE